MYYNSADYSRTYHTITLIIVDRSVIMILCYKRPDYNRKRVTIPFSVILSAINGQFTIKIVENSGRHL